MSALFVFLLALTTVEKETLLPWSLPVAEMILQTKSDADTFQSLYGIEKRVVPWKMSVFIR